MDAWVDELTPEERFAYDRLPATHEVFMNLAAFRVWFRDGMDEGALGVARQSVVITGHKTWACTMLDIVAARNKDEAE